MKIKLDENLPSGLAVSLGKLGHDVHTANEEGLTGHSDRELWEATQKEARFLITQDLDFGDLRRFAPGSHHGILMVRLRSPSRMDLRDEGHRDLSNGRPQRLAGLFCCRYRA